MRDKAKSIITEVIACFNAKLIAISINEHFLNTQVKVVIDAVDGVKLDLCAKINKQIVREFDAAGIYNQKYTVEVASAGLDRKLKDKNDFENCLGKELNVIYKINENNQIQVIGTLIKIKNNKLVLKITEEKTENININDIIKAKLEIRW